jgi:chromosome segregation protein
MLRIEKVFLQGFKSFCDATELVFDAEGITAVVGPNGCGKSNVSDALSWVIGEQRAKALRGSKMEDVIFQGSRHRQPSGMAEVLLSLRVEESFEIQTQEKEAEIEAQEAPVSGESLSGEREASAAIPVTTATTPDLPEHPARPAPATRTRLKASALRYQAGERLTVARRLYRTGESEYELNGRLCRLRDIQDLFAGTGLGGAHYAIIEQGRIGQVLSAKPLDRRALIEEAAGISKFKLRQRAAEVKLDAAKHNLARVTDIIAEVERQQGALKRQAAKARRYQRLRHEMRELMKLVFVAEYRTTQQACAELQLKQQEISTLESELARRSTQTETARQTALALTDQLDQNLTQAREEVAQTNLQIEKALQQQNYLNDQILSLTTRGQQFSQDQIALTERGHFIAQEIASLREKLRILEQEINAEATSLSQAEKEHLTQSSRDEQAEKDLELAQRQLTEAATHRERWRQLVRQFADAYERYQHSLAGLTAEQLRAREQAQKIALEFTAAENQLATTTQKQQAGLSLLAQINQTLGTTQAAAASLAQELQALQQQQTAVEQRLKSLLELEERRAYFTAPVQAVLLESKKSGLDKNFHIIGTLADFIKVNPQDEALVEVGLKEELQYLLTPSFEDALQAIAFLKREQLGRATFLVLNPARTPNGHHPELASHEQIKYLLDLLGVNSELRTVLQQALPKLAQTVITAEVQQAIAESIRTNSRGHSFLTPSGEFVSAGHIISGGSQAEASSGILALKREITELRAELQILTELISEREEQAAQGQAELQEMQARASAMDWQSRETEKELVSQRGLQQQYARDQERAAAHLRVVEKEMAQAAEESAAVTTKLHQAQAELQQAEQALNAAEALTTQAQASGLEMRRHATERTQELSRRRADFAAKSERRKALQQDIKRLETETQELSQRLNRAQFDSREAEQQAQQRREAQLSLQQELAAWQEQQQSQVAQVETLARALTQEKEKLLDGEQELEQCRTRLAQFREERAELDITRTKLLASLEYLEAASQAELGEGLSTLLAQSEQTSPVTLPPLALDDLSDKEEADFPEDNDVMTAPGLDEAFDLDAGKLRLQELRSKVESLGPVNFLALDELGALEQRLIFLLQQKADIEQAVGDTLSAIAELKRRSRERFVTAFHHINQNFSEMFLELFGGGHAEMRLIDETDVLESGIDIIAQPPGKRLQNVLLLSGGEKAMAALALVLGIFKFRPSPFCILDEVDAPLDDVNIGRFSDKILELSQRTQFLVITHSKRTMEAARTLYGVTMEDPGISKLISVRLT